MMWKALLCLIGLSLCGSRSTTAQETLTLTTPETRTIAASWQVAGLHIDATAPNIEVTLKSNVTGERFVWRYIVCQPISLAIPPVVCGPETGTLAQVKGAIGIINRGEFMTKTGQTLNVWILTQLNLKKIKVGVVAP